MQTIGERLEEARKRKGISLREAAEATKIRGDFLSSIEQNKFDFDLPEIYKRGFLKNYARYLKLDVETIITDYNAQLLSSSRLGKKAGSEWFGQMEVKKPEKTDDPEPADDPEPLGSMFTKSARATEGHDLENSKPEREEEEEEESDKTFYLKIGLIFVGTLALVFVVFGLIWAILSSGSSDTPETRETPELRDTPSISETLTGNGAEPVSASSITLVASGDLRIIVRQKADREEIYRGTLSAGDRVDVQKTGPVDVLFTAGEHLTVEYGDERVRPGSSGTAYITIP